MYFHGGDTSQQKRVPEIRISKISSIILNSRLKILLGSYQKFNGMKEWRIVLGSSFFSRNYRFAIFVSDSKDALSTDERYPTHLPDPLVSVGLGGGASPHQLGFAISPLSLA